MLARSALRVGMTGHKLTLDSNVKLSDGNLVPRLGLGVYEMSDAEASLAVTWALEAGYRHFDW